MECFTYSKTSNGTQGEREIIQCDDPEKQYCFMVYSITEENYDPTTNTIIDTNDIVATNGKCIGLQDKIDVGKGIGFMFNVWVSFLRDQFLSWLFQDWEYFGKSFFSLPSFEKSTLKGIV